MNIFCTSVSLFRAIDSGDARLTSMLLAGGVDVNLAEPTGQTPLLAATRGNRLKVAELLVQQGADVNAQFPFKTPPIHLFMRGKNAIELTGYTPLMCAAENSNVMMIKLLLDKGADPKLKNKAGETALDIAHKLGDEQTVRVLEDANRRTLNE
jgi:ankyrin repeat protein